MLGLAALCGLTAISHVEAASQIWTNAPVDANWATAANWVGNAVPGNVAPAPNGLSGDTATFNSPLPISGIGGLANPIQFVDQRCVKFISYDTADCGAYVLGTVGGANLWLAGSNVGAFTGGSILVNPAVSNPQEINSPIHIRLPNSTNGRFDIVNNSTNPAATLTLDLVANDSATSRPLTLNLGGTGATTNVIRQIGDTSNNGAIHLIKQGTATWVIAGVNGMTQRTSGGDNVPANIVVSEGILVAKDAASLGAITAPNVVVSNTGTLLIDGVTLNNAGITLRAGGTVQMKGSGTVNGVTVGNTAGTLATLSTTGSGDVMTLGGTGVFNGGAADTVLRVAGPGMVDVAVDSTYAGRWSADSGTVRVTAPNALGGGANFHLAAGATLDLAPQGAAPYGLTTAGFSAAGTGTAVDSTAAAIRADAGGTVNLTGKAIALTFTPTAFVGDTAHPALLVQQGTLSLGGNSFTVNNAGATPLAAGTYRLIQQASGAIASAGGFAVTVTGTGKAAATIAAIQVVGGDVNLVITDYVAQNLVWKGGNPGGLWDAGVSANWLSGATPAFFTASDIVTFNSVGAANPTVDLQGVLAPGKVVVDTSGNDYTFGGSGQIAGTTSLTKVGSGVLLLQTANTYSGGTVISNGTLRVGAANAVSGAVTVRAPGVLGLGGLGTTIAGLDGDGTVDNAIGGDAVLTVGSGNGSGTFSGLIKNTSATVGLTKIGNGAQTLASANTYSGPTVMNAGTLRVGNLNALGSGVVTNNAGTLDLMTDALVAGLNGSGGTVVNASGSGTNRLIVQGTSTYGGLIADGAGGAVRVRVNAGVFRLDGANTYSGGTVVAEGAGLAFGNVGQAGSGGVVVSNNTTVAMPTANNPSAGVAAAITTVDGATTTLTSGTTANGWNGQFNGGANSTNIFAGGNMSIGGAYSFSNFLGTVVVTNGGVRWFNAMNGGDNTTFRFIDGGGAFTRDATIVRLGALTGNGAITAPSVTAPGNYWIGAKNIDTTFSGTISGSNNIVKTGTGLLVLNGRTSTPLVVSNNDGTFTTNVFDLGDGTFFTNIVDNADGTFTTNQLYAAALSYIGSTTVSNGTLAVVVPNNLDASLNVTLASSTAVLDASSMGYVSNLVASDGFTVTNSVLVTNGTFNVIASQTFGGSGTLKGKLVTAPGSFFNPGLTTGTLTVTGQAMLGGGTAMEINTTNAVPNDQLSAASIVYGGDLTVANSGPEITANATYKLFNGPVSGAFNSVSLPPLASPLSWENRLMVDGTIRVVGGTTVNPQPAPIVAAVVGGNLAMSWPADRTGWTLQVQANPVTVGISNNWENVVGSALTNMVSIPLASTNGTVFYRLVYP